MESAQNFISADLNGTLTVPLPVFVDEIDGKLTCVQCKRVLQQPLQTPCGHRMCRACWDTLIQGHASVPCPARESDCELVTPDQVHLDYSIQRELNQLRVMCPNQKHGCDVVIKWGKLSQHIEHECLQAQIDSPKVKVLEREVHQLTSQNNRLEEQLHHMAAKLASLETLCKKLESDLTNRPIATASASTLDEHEQRLNKLETVGFSNNAVGNHVPTTGELGDVIRRHDRHLAILDVRQAEGDLRMLSMESTNYSGVLVWKISDYQRRKREAVAGTTLSLYSQPFFTGRYGYRMCARAYPNGDGQGRGTHLSLFFVVMRGECDNLLPWPFTLKVTMTLMEQEGGRRHLTDTFRPDPGSSSFRKPLSEMNVASGCPLFCRHSQLEQSPFLKDDSIFIKITVDTNDLSIY